MHVTTNHQCGCGDALVTTSISSAVLAVIFQRHLHVIYRLSCAASWLGKHHIVCRVAEH